MLSNNDVIEQELTKVKIGNFRQVGKKKKLWNTAGNYFSWTMVGNSYAKKKEMYNISERQRTADINYKEIQYAMATCPPLMLPVYHMK